MLKRKNVTIQDLLAVDCTGVDPVIDLLNAWRARRSISHMLAILISKDGRMFISSDMSRAAENMVLDRAKSIVLDGTLDDRALFSDPDVESLLDAPDDEEEESNGIS